MAKKRGSGAQDPATKNTLNPPNQSRGPERKGGPPEGHGTGQFTGEGHPSLQKK